jgi:two-component system, chemotaxis family, protein-glutamate methylesterase/glutaminase
MPPIRALVADDSATVRARIVDALSQSPEFDVVAVAGDGQEAIELCAVHRPDVITLDMMMPRMNGLEATEHIMAYFPTPIVIVSASTNRGELFRTYEALAAGALDVIEKPKGTEAAGVWDRQLLDTLRLAAKIRVITHPKARLRRPDAPAGPVATAPADTRRGPRHVIAIGASTGGPAAVVDLLHVVPRHYPFPILLVLHLSAPFASALAEWLGRESQLPVRTARDGDPLPEHGVVLAPADQHLVLDGARLRLTMDTPRHSCRPSVDVLFESVARQTGPRSVGVLLTGMGRDGAEGLLAIRRAGGITIAQDEDSSAVYGMPREAAAIGAAQHVMSPAAAGAFVASLATSTAER